MTKRSLLKILILTLAFSSGVYIPPVFSLISVEDSLELFDSVHELVKSEQTEAGPSLPAAVMQNNKKDAAPTPELEHCGDKVFGIEFLCNPQWNMQFNEDSILIVISKEPDVSLIIAKMPSKYFTLEQMKTQDLLDLKQYADGFKMERIKFAGQPGVMVKAFAKQDSDKRVLDYFVIRDKTLYTFLFSISPSAKWDDYKFLIKKVADSFQLIDPATVQWRDP